MLSAGVGRGRRAGGPLHLHRPHAIQAHCGARPPDLDYRGLGNKRPKTTRIEGDIFAVLREALGGHKPARLAGLPPFTAGAVGYFAYDAVRQIERLPNLAKDELANPGRLSPLLRRSARLRSCAQRDLARGYGRRLARQCLCRIQSRHQTPRQSGTTPREAASAPRTPPAAYARQTQSPAPHREEGLYRRSRPHQGVHPRRRCFPSCAVAASRY